MGVPYPLAGLVSALLLAAVATGASAQDPGTIEEIRSISGRSDVRDAFRAIEALDTQSLAELIELTQIPAPPFQEDARANRLAELLGQAGADSVWIDHEGNVIALRRGSGGGRAIALGGHLDTVFPEGTDVTVRQHGDTLFAPGIGDDTRGLIVVLNVLRALEEAGVETVDDVLFVGTVGEEGLGDLRGMKALFAPDVRPIDVWIEIDGDNFDRIVNQALGSHRYRVTFKGTGGHSWGDFGRGNPAHALARTTVLFEEVADGLTRSGPRTSYSVGRLGGGTSVNSIPFEAWMEVDMRSVSPERLEIIDEALQEAVRRGLREANALRREGDPLQVDVDMIGNRPSGELSSAAPLVQHAIAATRFMGGDPYLDRSSTNSNIPISLGVPAVTLGRGGIGGENHSPGEWWINEAPHLAIQRALLVVLAAAGTAPAG